jgi:pimeloyl-ACP methyl ester carboxylesterase
VPYLELGDGLPLYYEEHGDGPPVVLVPGWTITTRFWERQVEDLARDHRVVTLDLRGAGNSGKTPDRHSLSSYAADLDELLSCLDLRGVTLVGFAMAVSVGVHYLAEHGTERVSRFVWVDHSPCFFSAPNWPYGLFGNFGPSQLDELVVRLRNDRPAVTRELLDLMFAPREQWMLPELLKTPTEVAVAMIQTVANADLRPHLSLLDLPVLLVNGERSVVPPEVGVWLAEQLPRADRLLLAGAGHAPFWDDPDTFNAALRRFAATG